MIKNTYINLATRNVIDARTFYVGLGLSINETYSDAQGICVVINKETFMMVMTEDRFESFTMNKTPDSFKQNEVILTFELSSKQEVDDFMNKVINCGGKAFGNPVDMDFMYYQAFTDLDGHHFEVFYFKK